MRSETALSEGAVSVSYAAVELARKIFGNLKGRTVLVLGAGEMGKLTAIHMQSQGIGRLIITSRTRRARHGARAVDRRHRDAVGVAQHRRSSRPTS